MESNFTNPIARIISQGVFVRLACLPEPDIIDFSEGRESSYLWRGNLPRFFYDIGEGTFRGFRSGSYCAVYNEGLLRGVISGRSGIVFKNIKDNYGVDNLAVFQIPRLHEQVDLSRARGKFKEGR